MKVGITMRVIENTAYHETRDAISHEWLHWIKNHDAIPVLLPNIVDSGITREKRPYDILILSNGNDVVATDSSSYGDYSQLRNDVEFELIQHAIDNGIPILGICHGMQLLNIFFGGKLICNITNEGFISHVANNHSVVLEPEIANMFGKNEVTTNSYHNHGVVIEGLSTELCIIARCSEDDLVEAFYHKSHPVIGVQWHPERACSATNLDEWLLDNLLFTRHLWNKS